MRKNNLIRVDSSEVQGPESFVLLRKPTWKTMRTVMQAQEKQGQQSDAELGLLALEIAIPSLIVNWNWAKESEDGTEVRLPVPADDPDVIEQLDMEEVMFLIKHVTPLLSEMKTSRPNSSAPS